MNKSLKFALLTVFIVLIPLLIIAFYYMTVQAEEGAVSDQSSLLINSK